MGARDRTEDGDEHHQDSAGRDRVSKQRDRLVSTREPLGHDAGADHGGDQDGGAERLRQETPLKRTRGITHSAAVAGASPAPLALPIVSNCFCNASLSREPIGKLTKIEIRLLSIGTAGAKGSRSSAPLPVAAAGSGTPKCAVIGWPGHTGHASAAASSQTVKTKSRCGASGRANSLQLLER